MPINLAHQDSQSGREKEAEAQPGPGGGAGGGSVLRNMEGQTRPRPQARRLLLLTAHTERGQAASVLLLQGSVIVCRCGAEGLGRETGMGTLARMVLQTEDRSGAGSVILEPAAAEML